MAEMMAEPIPRKQSKGDWLSDVKSKLSHYEAEYQQLKKATLALWKTKLDELGKGGNTMTMSNKKRKIDGSDLRSRCRISCGADIVIQHVLPYLVVPILSKTATLMKNLMIAVQKRVVIVQRRVARA